MANLSSPSFTVTPLQSNHLSLILPLHSPYLSAFPYLSQSYSIFSQLILMIDDAHINFVFITIIVYYWFILLTKDTITKNSNNNNNNNCNNNLWNYLTRVFVNPYSTNQSFIRNSLVVTAELKFSSNPFSHLQYWKGTHLKGKYDNLQVCFLSEILN